MRMIRNWLLVTLATLVLAPATEAQQFAVAGSPVESIRDRNYERLFQNLRDNGIHFYFPTFQYQEVPEARSLGFEEDFSAPCSPDDPGFRALRATGMQLILSGELVYADPGRLGRAPRNDDPLSQILACAGREHIAAITNYDEAAFHGRPIGDVADFYAHVKAVIPDLPVLMVHGPIITDKPEFSSAGQIEEYLANVQAYSAHADIVGFDIYPFPAFLAKLATPLSNGAEVEESRAIREYMSWLNDAVPSKRKLIVMQGFAYTNLYEKGFREANFPQELLDAIKAPTKSEMSMMVDQALAAGAELLIWWGPSSLPDADTAPWPTILDIARGSR